MAQDKGVCTTCYVITPQQVEEDMDLCEICS